MVQAAIGLLILGCSKTRGVLPSPTPCVESTPTPSPSVFPVLDGGLAGEWLVSYSWGCGSLSETTWLLYPDGTFFAPAVNRGGTWHLEGREFALTFPYSPFARYTGRADPAGEYLEGTMAGDDGSRGCWHARKSESAP